MKLERKFSGPVPIRAVPGYLKISRAIAQLVLSGKTLDILVLVDTSDKIFIVVAVARIEVMVRKMIFLLFFDSFKIKTISPMISGTVKEIADKILPVKLKYLLAIKYSGKINLLRPK